MHIFPERFHCFPTFFLFSQNLLPFSPFHYFPNLFQKTVTGRAFPERRSSMHNVHAVERCEQKRGI